MNSKDIKKTLDAIAPAIDAIADPAIKVIIHQLLLIIAEQQKIIESQRQKIEELEEKLKINSNNSSTPPSADNFKREKKKKQKRRSDKKRKQGGQPGHPGKACDLLPLEEEDKVEQISPPKECSCGAPDLCQFLRILISSRFCALKSMCSRILWRVLPH